MEEEMEICSNCKRQIRSINYVIHSVHCHRNIVICPKCKEPVPRSELAHHDSSEHGYTPCSACGESVENSLLKKHVEDICVKRRVTCVYCELELEARERAEHENYCGSRTEKCEECGEFVMMKYQTLHLDSNHGFIKLSDEPGPSPSWEPHVDHQRPLQTKKAPLKSILKSPPLNPVKSPRLYPVESSRLNPVQASQRASKILNVEQEVKRSVTVKQENCQPQVNAMLQEFEKKPDVTADHDLDRLLALKLAQEEMELRDSELPHNGVATYTPRSPTYTPLASTYTPLASIPAFMTDSDDDEELAAAIIGLPKPPNPPFQKEIDVELPCEFCDILVPASRLVLHQTGCRPDLARLQPTNLARTFSMLRNDLSDEHEKEERHKVKRPEDMIPCDLCGKDIEIAMFMQHQLACEIRHLPGRQAKRPQALVMPLSGRTLVSSLMTASSPPSSKNLLVSDADIDKKTSNKPAPPGDAASKPLPLSESASFSSRLPQQGQTTDQIGEDIFYGKHRGQCMAKTDYNKSDQSQKQNRASRDHNEEILTRRGRGRLLNVQSTTQHKSDNGVKATDVGTGGTGGGAVPKQKARRFRGEINKEIPSATATRNSLGRAENLLFSLAADSFKPNEQNHRSPALQDHFGRVVEFNSTFAPPGRASRPLTERGRGREHKEPPLRRDHLRQQISFVGMGRGIGDIWNGAAAGQPIRSYRQDGYQNTGAELHNQSTVNLGGVLDTRLAGHHNTLPNYQDNLFDHMFSED